MVTEVSFYHLTVIPVERAMPKLLEKVYASGKKVLIRVAGDDRAKELDQILWTYSPNDFLPHGLATGAYPAEQPVLITTHNDNLNQADVLLMVGASWIENWKDFDRCLLMFDGHRPDELEFARAQWLKVKEAGVAQTYWKQTEQGNWQKAA